MALVSISYNAGINYTSPVDDYSPARLYPEYLFEKILLGENHVYELIRGCLHHYGADKEHYDTSIWNPLGQWVNKGDRVFILPNLVSHRRPFQSNIDFMGTCIHGSILRTLLDYVFIATGTSGIVSVGNAPLQECDYDKVTKETGIVNVAEFFRRINGHNIGPYDLRIVKTLWSLFGTVLLERREQNTSDAVYIDLGKDSLLDELFDKSGRPVEVRVADYDGRETMSYHTVGKHIYVVNRRILESDIIISLPKLKTHEKVGVTCALKGAVGSIARKECLAHHRRGAPTENGDEYPKSTRMHDLVSHSLDLASQGGRDFIGNAIRFASKVGYRLLRAGKQGVMGGAWYGNDTSWRMTLDIQRILRYARPDGTMSDLPQRKHIALVDGIVSGEGDGPLKPRAKNTGVVLFSSDICAVDYVAALTMGFDVSSIPLINNAFKSMRWPLTDIQPTDIQFLLNGNTLNTEDLKERLNFHFVPPKGWVGHIEI